MSLAEPIQFLGFLLDERHYGVRLSQALRVVRAVDYTPLPRAPLNILGIIDMHGEIVPLYNIRRKLGLIERDIQADDQFIIALSAGRTVALAVDSVAGIISREADALIEIDSAVSGTEQIEGVITLTDGLMLIHNLERFLSDEERKNLELSLTELARHGS